MYTKDRDALERVQKYYTRRLFVKCGLKKTDYESRLKFLGLDKLDVRRLKLDLVACYNMFHQLTPDCDVLSRSKNTRETRQEHQLLKDTNVCLARCNYFSNRVVNCWNELPANIIEGSEDDFKAHLKL